jgi:Flp pilus assembly protein TadD
MYLLWGSGIPADGHRRKGSVEQVCATLLALAGLPPARDLAAGPLPGASSRSGTAPVDYQAYYEPMPAPASSAGARADADSLAKLKALGYIADGGPAGRAGETRTPGSYNNEGVILRNAGKTSGAIAAFEHALEGDPNLASALWNLSDLLFGKAATADRSDELLVRAYASGLPEGTRLLIGRAIGYQRAGQAPRSLALVNGGLDARPNEVELWLFRGRYRVEAGDCRGAAGDFRRAEALAPAEPAAFAAEGLAQLCAGDRDAARTALTRALQLDPNQPKVREFLNTLERRP